MIKNVTNSILPFTGIFIIKNSFLSNLHSHNQWPTYRLYVLRLSAKNLLTTPLVYISSRKY